MMMMARFVALLVTFTLTIINECLSKNLENSSRPPGLNETATTSTISDTEEFHNSFSITTLAPNIPDGYVLAASYSIPGTSIFSVTPNKIYYAEVCGAQGSNNCNNPVGVSYGGLGGCVYSYFSSPSSTLTIVVGGQGNCPAGGSNGGGKGHCSYESVGQFGGGGGGASDIRTGVQLNSRVVVGGGGGGAGYDGCTGLTGGNGGGLVAGAGSYGQTWATPTPGQGGTQVAGGAGGIFGGYNPGSPGNISLGGEAGVGTCGGGGGGGYYGGGGAAWTGGGGGSSYSMGSIVQNLLGAHSGDGIVNIYSTASETSSSPTEQPTAHPSSKPAAGSNKTYVGLLSYKDPLKCKVLHSFMIYPTSSCLVMANAHPDESGFISGYNKYSCGSNGALIMSYSPKDATCSLEPYDIYALPNYDKCPAEAELQMHTCLTAASFPMLFKSVRGVVNTVYTKQEDCFAQRATGVVYLTYSPTSFLTGDGVPLYRCTTTSKKSSYVYVCHGPTGFDKLVYSTSNCKGKATVIRRTFFVQLDEYCSGTTLTTLPTCMGPSTF